MQEDLGLKSKIITTDLLSWLTGLPLNKETKYWGLIARRGGLKLYASAAQVLMEI